MPAAEAPITLRPAAPARDDGLAFARLLEEAQESMFRIALGPRVTAIVAEAFTRPGHDLSYEHVTFAELDGHIVAMASAYSAETHRTASDEPLATAAGWRRHRFAAFARVNRRLLGFMDTIPDGDVYVRALAVDPAHRSTGIGTQLLGSVEDAARTAGASRLSLDVAAKNEDGRRLYERFGMTAEAESRRWFGIPNSNVIRMAKPL